MTIRNLSRYYFIKKEIDQLEEQLKELSDSVIGSPAISGMPSSHGNTSPIEQLIIKKNKLEEKLLRKKNELLEEQIYIENYLETIKDERIRIIIRERFINCKKWEEIGRAMYFDRTTPYYAVKRYLKGNKEDEKENDDMGEIRVNKK